MTIDSTSTFEAFINRMKPAVGVWLEAVHRWLLFVGPDAGLTRGVERVGAAARRVDATLHAGIWSPQFVVSTPVMPSDLPRGTTTTR